MRSLLGLALIANIVAMPAVAQTANSWSSTRTAYGIRMTQPEGVEDNSRRVNNRINNRINSRLSTRLERYTPVADPAASMRAPVAAVDRARKAVEQPVEEAYDDPK